jgi:UDPglucose 6-dehydrogenase
VLSWVPGGEEPQFLSVMCLTRRDYDGDLVDVSLKTGRRIRTTPDHGWIVGDGAGGEPTFKLAGELTTGDWVPLALGTAEQLDGSRVASLIGAAEAAELSPRQLIVRPSRAHIDALVRAEIPLEGSTISTTKNGNQPRSELTLDERFWRVLGLYLAEGHVSIEAGGRHRIQWSFHPTREQHLVDEVVGYWLSQNVKAIPRRTATAQTVSVSSRLLGSWWTQVLGLGRGSYGQRLPDLLWDQSDAAKWAVLSGLFEGDGSWSLVNGGPSVIVELGTVSDELADGVLRLLASLGIVASERTARATKSTKDTHWLRISGADQVQRALALVPERDRAGVLSSLQQATKRIRPTGHRRFGDGPAWVRVTGHERRHYAGPVYSLEVPYAHTVVATDGVVVPQCFPKDVSALKQLAGNSGYHFQLLTAVIEVNELQKRRVVGKLQKHLGSLVGKRIALLGLAFKPDTDDMREASSLVLSARLQADGATVAAYDPIAEEEARKLMPGVDFADTALAAVRGADACVLVTEWHEFSALDWSEVADAMAGSLIVDGRNFIDREAVLAAGLGYEGIGR